MAGTSSDRSTFGKRSISYALHALSGLAISGLIACGFHGSGSGHGHADRVARHVAINVASSSLAESARVSIKVAMASREARQLCKLVMAGQGVKLTWAEGDSESRAQHGLTALRHCAAMLLQDVSFGSTEQTPETC
jgi:hypothetical protein